MPRAPFGIGMFFGVIVGSVLVAATGEAHLVSVAGFIALTVVTVADVGLEHWGESDD